MLSDTPSITPPAAISLTFVVLLYGIHLIVFPFAVAVLLQKRMTRSILVMLGAVTFMFAMSTLLTATLWTATLIDGSIPGIYFNPGYRARILMWPKNMNVICADAMVLQRMFVLYPSRWIRGPMGFLMFAFTCMSIFNSIGEPIHGPLERAVFLNNVATFLSFGINALATGAITWRAWEFRSRHRRRASQAGNLNGTATSVNHALLVLVETGLFYLAWQFSVAMVTHYSNCDSKIPTCANSQYAANALVGCTTMIAGLFPTTTLVIVAMRRSIADSGPDATSTSNSATGLISACSTCGGSSSVAGHTTFEQVKFNSPTDAEMGYQSKGDIEKPNGTMQVSLPF